MEAQLSTDTGQPGLSLAYHLRAIEDKFLLEMSSKGRSQNTLKNYRTDLECFNQYLMEKQQTLDISAFGMNEILEYGKYLQVRYQSDNSRRRRVQALRLFFDFLLQLGKVESNPVKKIPVSPKFLDIPRPARLVDIKTLWQYLLDESTNHEGLERLTAWRNLSIVLLIYTAGLKVSDLAHMKENQLFLDEDHPRLLVTPERRDPYTIMLSPFSIELFRKYLQFLHEVKAKQGIVFDELLFNANPYQIISGGLSARGLELIFQEWGKQLKMEIKPKSLRQAAIFRWLHQKHPDVLIKEWLGVAPSYSMKSYSDIAPEHVYNDTFFLVSLENQRKLH